MWPEAPTAGCSSPRRRSGRSSDGPRRKPGAGGENDARDRRQNPPGRVRRDGSRGFGVHTPNNAPIFSGSAFRRGIRHPGSARFGVGSRPRQRLPGVVRPTQGRGTGWRGREGRARRSEGPDDGVKSGELGRAGLPTARRRGRRGVGACGPSRAGGSRSVTRADRRRDATDSATPAPSREPVTPVVFRSPVRRPR